MKTIKDAVIELGGKWINADNSIKFLYVGPTGFLYFGDKTGDDTIICTKEQFESEAKRMQNKPNWDDAPVWANYLMQSEDGGWSFYERSPMENFGSNTFTGSANRKGHVFGDWKKTLEKRPYKKSPLGKYEWGKEYLTNGKRPDLPDDVEVSVYGGNYSDVIVQVRFAPWTWIKRFKITDPCYKPVDEVSEISESKPDAETASEKPESNWHERGELPPVGSRFESYFAKDTEPKWNKGKVAYSSNEHTILVFDDGEENYYETGDLKKIAKFRPIRIEREKVIETACMFLIKDSQMLPSELFAKLYDAGMLVLPPKKSDTED